MHQAGRVGALALGPGLGRAAGTTAFVRGVLEAVALPAVVDADGLWHLGERPEWLRGRRAATVLTPHAGEAARLLGRERAEVEADRLACARELAELAGAVVVLKGAGTITCGPRGAAVVNGTGTPALATAGSGDVLTGVVAAALAKGMAPLAGAAAAVAAHGRAAELAGARRRADRRRRHRGAPRRPRPVRALAAERAVARIDLGAIRHNAGVLARAAGGAELLAVVKADGYGHGAAAVARAALDGGARRLGVATAGEAEALRAAGVDAPVLVMGPLIGDEWPRAVAAGAEVAVWTPQAAALAASLGARAHLKLDTGMGRLGARPDEVGALAAAAEEARLEVAGVMTHLATADVTDGEEAGFMAEQLLRFRALLGPLRERFPGAPAHAANSAATLREPAAAFDLVRCGIALYGCSPFERDPAEHGLRPAMSLVSYLASVKPAALARERRLRAHLARGPRHVRGRRAGRLRRRLRAGPLQPRPGPGGRPPGAGGGDGVDGPAHARPRAGAGRGGGGRGGADRRPGAGADPRRGGGGPARHHQLRGGLRRGRAGAARAPVSAPLGALAAPLGPLRGRGEAWLVGGGLRDALLGRPVTDVDVALAGDARAAAYALARAHRAVRFPLSARFGAWRVQGGRLGLTVDLTPLQGASIVEDLARRDLTVNALALPLDAPGEMLDPHGGLADLAARRLRLVSPQALAADPVRLVRLARLARQLGFAVDPAAAVRARADAGALAAAPGERVMEEFARLLRLPEAWRGIWLLDEIGVLTALVPELEAARGLEQSPYHHRDVLGHVLEVVREADRLVADPAGVFRASAPRVAAYFAQPLADGLTRGQVLLITALLHDMAKPETFDRRPDGRVTFMGHDRLGAEEAEAWCRRMRTSTRLRDTVVLCVRQHLPLGFLVHRQPLSLRQIDRYLRATAPCEVDVVALSVADRLATRGPRTSESAIARHLALARQVVETHHRLVDRGPPPRLLSGDELARAVGRPPGPWLSDALEALREEQVVGAVVTREQAARFAERYRLGQQGDPEVHA